MDDLCRLTEAVARGDAAAAAALASAALAAGIEAERLVFEYLTPAMDEVGRRFAAREVFLPELLTAARAMKEALERVRPALAQRGERGRGKVVLGTVAGDVHDIGKKLVAAMLEGSGFLVEDLGIDVPAERFVAAVRESRPDLLGLSGLLSSALPEMRAVLAALEQAGLRERVRVLVGGAPLTRALAEEMGADGYAADAAAAVGVARALVAREGLGEPHRAAAAARPAEGAAQPAAEAERSVPAARVARRAEAAMSSRELVQRTLAFADPPRIPRQLWLLPWAEEQHPAAVADLRRRFPDDLVSAPCFCRTPPPCQGERHGIGRYVDEWGCAFENRRRGVIGEVKEPLVPDWGRVGAVHIPVERLSVDLGAVNEFCRATDRFVLAGAFPRPFEQLQFIRGTENLLIDLVEEPPALFDLLRRMHAFYLDELEVWARSDVDALMLMDDWGGQEAMLVAPDLWRRIFKPLYRDYVEVARGRGKKVFMHSDGWILDILPDLVEIGVDAVNCQAFCMDLEELGARFAGRITFWGELDRQHLLPRGSRAEILAAAARLRRALHRAGGFIAQCEFGVGADPRNVAAFFAAFTGD